MKKCNIILAVFYFLTISLTAVTQEKIGTDSMEQKFKAFKAGAQQEFSRFKNRNDSIFLKALEENWKEFQLFREEIRPRPKPQKQPAIPGVEIKKEEKLQPKQDSIIEIQLPNTYSTDLPPLKNSIERITGEPTMVDFYGQKLELSTLLSLPATTSPNTKNIIAFYNNYLANKDLQNTTTNLIQIAGKLQLNDWGRYCLLQKSTGSIFSNPFTRVLFSWISLLKEGYDVKIGYNRENAYLLMASSEKMYNTTYTVIKGTRYYLLTNPGEVTPANGLTSYEAAWPGSIRPVSLFISEMPNLPLKRVAIHRYFFEKDTITVRLNMSLIDFLKDYPDCELKVCFNAPLSGEASKSLDQTLKPLLNNKSEKEKVDLLLQFIQQTLPYETDEAQFGKENYLFADESFYYPYTDCDDRVVLLAALIKRYLGLKTIGLEYPAHVSLGVRFTNPLQGDHIDFDGEKYYICDPTYIGAKIGTAMDCMKDQTPQVIQANMKN